MFLLFQCNSYVCIQVKVFILFFYTKTHQKLLLFSSTVFRLFTVLLPSSHGYSGTFVNVSHEGVISGLSVCCSLDWRIAYQLYGIARPHIVTTSLWHWASTNPEGHRPFMCLSLFLQVSEMVEMMGTVIWLFRVLELICSLLTWGAGRRGLGMGQYCF